MNIEIRKAGVRGSLFLAYEYLLKKDDISETIKTKSTAPIHEDLQNAFKKLIPHFALICEEVEEEKVKFIITKGELLPEDLEQKFGVTDFDLSGDEENLSVKITGYKILSNNRSIGFATPPIALDDLNRYKYVEELAELIEVLRSEVSEYMDGKFAPRNIVGSFDFEDNEEEAFTLPKTAKEAAQEFVENIKSIGANVEITSSGKKVKVTSKTEE